MTAVVWTNIALAVPFVLGWAGIPLWMIVKHPDSPPDHSAAYAYLDAQAAPAVQTDLEPELAAA
jgi:hypothetical protein